MLVLSRKNDESVVLRVAGKIIGRLQVVALQGDRVRIGFTFPPEVVILREELDESQDAAA